MNLDMCRAMVVCRKLPNVVGVAKITPNVLRLCAGGVLKHESSKLVQKPIRITGVDVSESAPLAQNRC